jgi:hypothetical protein
MIPYPVSFLLRMQTNDTQRQLEWNVDLASLQWVRYLYIHRSLWTACSFYEQSISTVLLRCLRYLKLLLIRTNAKHQLWFGREYQRGHRK